MHYNYLGSTGMKVSLVGLGGAPFSDINSSFEQEYGIDVIREAYGHGINYFETGPWYGQGCSEIAMGKALSVYPRNTFCVVSNIGRYERQPERMFDYSAEKTEWGVDNTLKRLGMNYVDLIQVHDFSHSSDPSIILRETLPALQRAVDAGKARFIGLADYNLDLMKEIVEESEIKISVILSYAKSTLLDNRLQNYVEFFRRRGVAVINASATGMGLLTNKGPSDWHPASDEMKKMCLEASKFCRIRKIELGRLATYYTINQLNISTHVLGLGSLHEIRDTSNVLHHGLTSLEKYAYEQVCSRYFSKSTMHWDNVKLSDTQKRIIFQD